MVSTSFSTNQSASHRVVFHGPQPPKLQAPNHGVPSSAGLHPTLFLSTCLNTRTQQRRSWNGGASHAQRSKKRASLVPLLRVASSGPPPVSYPQVHRSTWKSRCLSVFVQLLRVTQQPAAFQLPLFEILLTLARNLQQTDMFTGRCLPRAASVVFVLHLNKCCIPGMFGRYTIC